MSRARISSEQRAAMDALADFLRSHADVFGPRPDGSDDGDGLDAEQMAELEAVKNPALVEHVTVMQWVDLDTGNSFTTRVHAPEMLPTHVNGLLAEWIE